MKDCTGLFFFLEVMLFSPAGAELCLPGRKALVYSFRIFILITYMNTFLICLSYISNWLPHFPVWTWLLYKQEMQTALVNSRQNFFIQIQDPTIALKSLAEQAQQTALQQDSQNKTCGNKSPQVPLTVRMPISQARSLINFPKEEMYEKICFSAPLGAEAGTDNTTQH